MRTAVAAPRAVVALVRGRLTRLLPDKRGAGTMRALGLVSAGSGASLARSSQPSTLISATIARVL
jgi:hypothetical protein